ncbi:hypothetical protein RclHR1_17220001 [Rhizophagus clarus]|uniref:Uncharacterized protein n=1 Tax=Rhizophagus clarus TaxID=94130 RepID=A0A2Z6RC92_9GLOM|nr:hypothetical protein RclHR1_17220001 [Rhizophagus clarus]
MNQEWSVSLLPFLLEQYLGIAKRDFGNTFSKDYRSLDDSSLIKIFRPYRCLVNEDHFSRITKQIMAVCGQNDRCLIKMLLKLSKELHEDILFY